MDDRTKYAAFTIPQRETPPAIEATPSPQSSVTNKVQLTDTKFAEIEFEINPIHTTASEAALRFFSHVTPPQQIEQAAIDPIRQKFFDMRALATIRPFARDDADLFYRQAKSMEGFSDDYKGSAKFQMYFPYYQHMGYEQLRTYFTWRTMVRQGEIQPTSISYVFLYIYELLSGIGVTNAVDGLNKLVSIWTAFREYGASLDNYVPHWLKDYHIYYELPHSFTDFIREHDLQKYYSMSLVFDPETENRLELWSSISSYDVMQSKFYNEGNEKLFEDCFDAVLTGIQEFCESRDAHFEDLLIYSISKRMPWQPFKHALFQNWQKQPDRLVSLPGQERYYCKNNQWSANLPIYYSSQKEFVGYILKKTESCLRQAVKYKYKLKADLKIAGHSFREFRGKALTIIELDSLIEKKVAAFHRNLTRTIVTVDHENLERIRKEALGTQDKLTVPDEQFVGDAHRASRNAPETRDANDQETGDFVDQETDDGWAALKYSLTQVECEALSIAFHGGASIKAFADCNGIMLEVLADSINEKAADYIGDNILELDDDMTIYDEYRTQVGEMIEG